MIEIFLLKNVVKYSTYIPHIVEIFLFGYLIWFDVSLALYTRPVL